MPSITAWTSYYTAGSPGNQLRSMIKLRFKKRPNHYRELALFLFPLPHRFIE